MERREKKQPALIREAREEDLPDIVRINLETLPEHYPDYFWRDHLRLWGRAFLVAEVDGRIVGYIMTRVDRGLGYLQWRPFKKLGHIVSIAVLPEYRRRGIGTALMVEAMRRLKEIYGASEAYLEVRVSNDAAIRLYEKLGFKKVRRLRKYYLDGEDAWLMAKKL